MSEDGPLLSICIPTYNRANLLRSALLSVGPQVIGLEDDVELIVSDNCSPDDTEDVVKEASSRFPIRYHKNSENIGAIKNVLILTEELARGEYCWVMGDDDLIIPGGVAKVLEVLRSNPDVDFVFVNCMHMELDRLISKPQPVSSFDIKEELRRGNNINEEYRVERWEQLIDPRVNAVFLGAIQLGVTRRSVWKDGIPFINVGKVYSNLDSTYPHIIVYAKGLVGSKAYYLGKPQIIVVDGAREWIGFIPIIVLVRLNEALDLYQSMGVDASRIRYCRKYLQIMCGGSFFDLFFNETSCGREYFSVKSFFRRYGITVQFAYGFVRSFCVAYYNGKIDRNVFSAFRFAYRRMFFKEGRPSRRSRE